MSAASPVPSSPSRPSYRETVARLAAAQKSNRGAAGYSRWVNRPLGRRLAAGAYLVGLTPNRVSVISAVFTYAAIVVIAATSPSWPLAVLVVVLLVLGYALDSADGQVARLRGGGSVAGEWLDHVFDAFKIATFHLAVAICWFRFYSLAHPATLLIPLAFSAISSTFFFAIILSDFLRRVERAKGGGSTVTTSSLHPQERAGVLRSLIVLPNDYGLLCVVMVLLPAHRVFIVVYGALAACNLAFLVLAGTRWFREMTALGAPPAGVR